MLSVLRELLTFTSNDFYVFFRFHLPDFLERPALVLGLLLLAGLVLRKWGKPLGLHWLFWHEEKGKQFLVGLVVGVVLAHIAFIGFLLDYGQEAGSGAAVGMGEASEAGAVAQAHPAGRSRWTSLVREREMDWPQRGTVLYLWYYRWWVLFAILGGLIANKRLKPGEAWAKLRPERASRFSASIAIWPLPLGFLCSVPLSVLGALLVDWIVTRSTVDDWILRLWVDLTKESPFHVVAALVFFLLLSVAAAVRVFDRSGYVPASAMIAVLIGGLLGAYGGFTFWVEVSVAPYGGLMLLAVVLLLLAWSGRARYKYRFRDIPLYDRPVKLGSSGAEPQPKPLRPQDLEFDQGKGPLVVVCTNGGGITAAAWTLAVLDQLEGRLDGFPNRTRLVTGASGGILGAAYWVSTLLNGSSSPRGAGDRQFHNETFEARYRAITEDSLSPVAQTLVFNDIWKTLFWPRWIRGDRGTALEEAWVQNTGGSLASTLADLHAGEKKGRKPSLVFSPMLIEKGRRLLISNLDLGKIVFNRAPRLGHQTGISSISALEFRRLFPETKLSLAAASRMSASFPYVSPAAQLPTRPPLRVVDAGYYDNFGVDVAAMWLLNYWESQDNTNQDKVNGVLIVEIDTSVRDDLERLPRPQTGERRDSFLGSVYRALQALIEPPAGLLNAVFPMQSYRNDELIELLQKHFSSRYDSNFFRTVRLINRTGASLSWVLTQKEKEDIRECAEEIRASDEVRELKAWWKSKIEA